MENQKLIRALRYIADGVRTGYSSVITFAYKEYLNAEESQKLVQVLQHTADCLEDEEDLMTIFTDRLD